MGRDIFEEELYLEGATEDGRAPTEELSLRIGRSHHG
jgi:hypothetical protein